MHDQLSALELAGLSLRAALLVYLHELRWENDNHRHTITIDASITPDGGLAIDVQGRDLVTHEMWGMTL